MNDKDLERELRSQHGPREAGYVPTQLPISLDPQRGRSAPSWLVRGAVFVPAAIAGALAVAMVSGILSGGGPNGVGAGSAPPSASSTPVASTATGPCSPEDVAFAAEPWGGAAGSRGTVVTVMLAAVRACTIGTAVSGQIGDNADGSVLVSGEQAGSGGSVLLEPDVAFTIGVAWSNWCGDEPVSPVLSLTLPEWNPLWVIVTVPAGGASPVPPCSGDAPSTLSLTELQPKE